MAKRKIKSSVKKAVFSCLVFVIFAIIIVYFLYICGLKPVVIENVPVELTIEPGETYLTIAEKLKEKNLIRSTIAYRIYVKLHKPTNFRAGTFSLNQNMGVKELIESLKNGSELSKEVISITFPEGKNMRQIAQIIASKTNNKEEEVFLVLQDKTNLK